MASTLRIRWPFLALALIAGGVVLAHPELLRFSGQDNADSAGQTATPESEEQTRAQCRELKQKIALRKTVAQDLIDGRTTLVSAVDQFMSMNSLDPNVMAKVRTTFPSGSDEESTALQVIFYVNIRLGRPHNSNGGADPEEVLWRLDLEMQEMKREIIENKRLESGSGHHLVDCK